MEIDFNSIADKIIGSNSIYSMSKDTLRDKVISLLAEQPYFVQQFEDAESEAEGEDIGQELGEVAFQVVTLIYKKMGLD